MYKENITNKPHQLSDYPRTQPTPEMPKTVEVWRAGSIRQGCRQWHSREVYVEKVQPATRIQNRGIRKQFAKVHCNTIGTYDKPVTRGLRVGRRNRHTFQLLLRSLALFYVPARDALPSTHHWFSHPIGRGGRCRAHFFMGRAPFWGVKKRSGSKKRVWE